ncbi:MAG: hypothetical protein SWK76_13535 [Actinomycetota bacterium]|nr:hypothetical protein [Actinomycetota bacterium]
MGDRECNALLKFIVKHGVYNMDLIEVSGVKVSPLEFMRSLGIKTAEIELEKIWKGEKALNWLEEYSLEAEVIGIRMV